MREEGRLRPDPLSSFILPPSSFERVLRYPGNEGTESELGEERFPFLLPPSAFILRIAAKGRPRPDTVSQGAEVSLGVETGSTDRVHEPRAHEGASPNEQRANEQRSVGIVVSGSSFRSAADAGPHAKPRDRGRSEG